jgi:hypothetical protein
MRLDRSKDISVHVSTCTSYDFNALTPVVWQLWRWIRRVCFYVSSQNKVTNRNSGALLCVPLFLVNWQTPVRQKLLLGMKHGAFNTNSKGNDEVCNGNNRHTDDRTEESSHVEITNEECPSLSSI